MKAEKEVWVYIQRQGSQIAEASLEIFSKGIDLARQLSVPVAAVVLGDAVQQLAETVSRYGAHRVYVLQSAQFETVCNTPVCTGNYGPGETVPAGYFSISRNPAGPGSAHRGLPRPWASGSPQTAPTSGSAPMQTQRPGTNMPACSCRSGPHGAGTSSPRLSIRKRGRRWQRFARGLCGCPQNRTRAPQK